MFETDIPFGHSASHAYVLVQLPNPSLSICATMFNTLDSLSGSPCGNNASWDTLALTNNIALLFLQAATQAPQPIQAAAMKASSASFLSIGIALASTALPVFTEMYPPAWIILSKASRSTIRSLMTGKAAAL